MVFFKIRDSDKQILQNIRDSNEEISNSKRLLNVAFSEQSYKL